MKRVFYLLLLIPMLVISQTSQEYTVIENGMITAHPAKIKQFEAGVAAHNKKYHADEIYGSRVYWISNGPNVGKYMWIMGPIPWSAFDKRPAQEGHDDDWNTNVQPYTMADGDQTYWRFHPELSGFNKDFTINKLKVFTLDINRFQDGRMMELMGKVKKVMAEKNPDQVYGIYTNELPSSKDGRDLAFVNFFEDSGWLGIEGEFPKKYNEVHGEGSFVTFLKDIGEVTQGAANEVWVFRSDLSGLSGEVKAATRQ